MSVSNAPNGWFGTLTAMFCAGTDDDFWMVDAVPAEIVMCALSKNGVPVVNTELVVAAVPVVGAVAVIPYPYVSPVM